MAIHIIGESTPTSSGPLPFPDLDLPSPNTAPAAEPVLAFKALVALLDHEAPLVRAFAVRRISNMSSDERFEALIRAVDDDSVPVARVAIDALVEAEHTAAIDTIVTRFSTGSGALAAEAAIALGKLAPDLLVDTVRARSRLDDYSYAITCMQLARSASEKAQAYLRKALDRAGASPPARRVPLYTSALLAGTEDLTRRVIDMALADSREGDKEDEPSPARVAIASAAGIPASMATSRAGAAVRRSLITEAKDKVHGDIKAAFFAALEDDAPAAAIEAVAPLADIEISTRAPAELQSTAKRCKTLLSVLLGRLDKIGQLDADGGTLFAAAALELTATLQAARAKDEVAPAIEALSKALDVEPKVLLDGTDEEVHKLFDDKAPREIQRVASILAGDPIDEDDVIDRIVYALLDRGHGTAVLDAAATSKNELLALSVLRVFPRSIATAEAVAIEAIERRPLEERSASLALAIASQLATKRLSLAVGRRFLDLREADRFRLTNAVLRLGDTRLAPLVEARAFADEPEEVAWVLLSLLDGKPIEGRLEEAKARIDRMDADEAEEVEKLRLPLLCGGCGETLSYRFARIFVDVQSKDRHGDPAFVGDTTCKACGAEESLSPTDLAIQIMTEEMVGFLVNSERDESSASPRVIPRRTVYAGREMGVAEALRQATIDVEASPESIRPRLRRARIRLLLSRKGALEDADHAVGIDPRSPEALYVRAGARTLMGDMAGGIEDLIQTLTLLRSDDEPRLYEESRELIVDETEQSLLQMESLGADLPEDLDLNEARDRLVQRTDQLMTARREMEAQRKQGGPTADPAQAQLPPQVLKKTKRNDPCPCGSGKKFKRCHGK